MNKVSTGKTLKRDATSNLVENGNGHAINLERWERDVTRRKLRNSDVDVYKWERIRVYTRMKEK